MTDLITTNTRHQRRPTFRFPQFYPVILVNYVFCFILYLCTSSLEFCSIWPALSCSRSLFHSSFFIVVLFRRAGIRHISVIQALPVLLLMYQFGVFYFSYLIISIKRSRHEITHKLFISRLY